MEWGLDGLGATAQVLIETPRFSVVKRRQDGSVDFVSPVPCPFNYGCILSLTSADGDALDAVVLGPRLARGHVLQLPVVGVVGFVDAGAADPKVICSAQPPSEMALKQVATFFQLYAVAKRALSYSRGIHRPTHTEGLLVGWRR